MRKFLSLFLVLTLILGVTTSSFAEGSGTEYKTQTIKVDKITFTVADNANKRIVTASSDNENDITVVYNKSTGKITKDGKEIGQVKDLGRIDKDSSKDKTISIASGMTWDDKPFYGSESDYTKSLGTYRKSVAITEAAIDGGRTLVAVLILAAFGVTSIPASIVYGFVASKVISLVLPYVYIENEKYQHKTLPGYWKNNFTYYRYSNFTGSMGSEPLYSTSW